MVELPLLVVIDLTCSGLVATGNAAANCAIFSSIYLLYSSWLLMADNKLSILSIIPPKVLSLIASLALMSRLILDCCIISSLKECCFENYLNSYLGYCAVVSNLVDGEPS